MRKISEISVVIGVVSCLFGAIWSPEESSKWVMSAIYISAVSRWFGLGYRKEAVKGMTLNRGPAPLNYLNLRVKK